MRQTEDTSVDKMKQETNEVQRSLPPEDVVLPITDGVKDDSLAQAKSEFGNRRKIIIKNLPADVAAQDVYSLLTGFTVESAQMERSSGSATAYVTLGNGIQADAAVTQYNNYAYHSRDITVNLSPIEAMLCVSNLPLSYTPESFRKITEPYGNIERCFLMYSEENGLSKGYGFVEYSTKDSARKAKPQLNGLKVASHSLRCDWADENHATYPKLHSTCLHCEMTKDFSDSSKFRSTFSRVAEPRYCQLAIGAEGKPMGFGIVAYETPTQAEKTQQLLNGQYLGGHPMRVSFITPGHSGRNTYTRMMTKLQKVPPTKTTTSTTMLGGVMSTGNPALDQIMAAQKAMRLPMQMSNGSPNKSGFLGVPSVGGPGVTIMPTNSAQALALYHAQQQQQQQLAMMSHSPSISTHTAPSPWGHGSAGLIPMTLLNPQAGMPQLQSAAQANVLASQIRMQQQMALLQQAGGMKLQDPSGTAGLLAAGSNPYLAAAQLYGIGGGSPVDPPSFPPPHPHVALSPGLHPGQMLAAQQLARDRATMLGLPPQMIFGGPMVQPHQHPYAQMLASAGASAMSPQAVAAKAASEKAKALLGEPLVKLSPPYQAMFPMAGLPPPPHGAGGPDKQSNGPPPGLNLLLPKPQGGDHLTGATATPGGNSNQQPIASEGLMQSSSGGESASALDYQQQYQHQLSQWYQNVYGLNPPASVQSPHQESYEAYLSQFYGMGQPGMLYPQNAGAAQSQGGEQGQPQHSDFASAAAQAYSYLNKFIQASGPAPGQKRTMSQVIANSDVTDQNILGAATASGLPTPYPEPYKKKKL